MHTGAFNGAVVSLMVWLADVPAFDSSAVFPFFGSHGGVVRCLG